MRGDMPAAEAWCRRVLAQSPLHPAATAELAHQLRTGGDDAQADRLRAEPAQCTGALVRLGDEHQRQQRDDQHGGGEKSADHDGQRVQPVATRRLAERRRARPHSGGCESSDSV